MPTGDRASCADDDHGWGDLGGGVQDVGGGASTLDDLSQILRHPGQFGGRSNSRQIVVGGEAVVDGGVGAGPS